MQNLLTAITNKISGSALSDDVGGRIYLDEAPDEAAYPRIVFLIVTDVPEKTFTEDYENIDIQFSLYSISESPAEIVDMHADLKTLFDECSLTITGSTLVWMKRTNMTTMVDDVTTTEGTTRCKHWAVDYEIKTSLN